MNRKELGKIASAFTMVAVILTPTMGVAGQVNTGPTTIANTEPYSSFGGGDFVVRTSVRASGCEGGFYLKASDPGFKSTVATILTAQASAKTVTVYGENTDLWSGGTATCRLYAVTFSS